MAKNNTPVDKNSREYLLRQVANGRYSLLLIVILTVVNLIMTILDTNTYFLFSASVPYYLVFVGMGIENGFVDGAWNVKGTLTYTGLVIALVIVAVYLLCWLLSKKRAGWLTAALVLFIIDTVALVVIAFALYDSPDGQAGGFPAAHLGHRRAGPGACAAARSSRRFPPRRNPGTSAPDRNSSFIHAGSSLEKRELLDFMPDKSPCRPAWFRSSPAWRPAPAARAC